MVVAIATFTSRESQQYDCRSVAAHSSSTSDSAHARVSYPSQELPTNHVAAVQTAVRALFGGPNPTQTQFSYDDEKMKMEPTPGPAKKSAREERRARGRGETVDSIRLLQEALPLATDSTTDDSDDEFQPQSARRQRKRKNSHYSTSGSDERKRPGKKSATEEVSQPVQSAPSRPQAKDARVPPVVLREKARWMAVNAELAQQAVRTTKVVNTSVGIRIQPASAADYRQLVRIVSVMKVQYHSYQLTEEKPLKIVNRGVSEEITEEEVAQDLAGQGFQHASCKRMLVGTERRSSSSN
ncbi:hypothetical protein Trydic_g15339 [Trypoxylus dichotomus]